MKEILMRLNSQAASGFGVSLVILAGTVVPALAQTSQSITSTNESAFSPGYLRCGYRVNLVGIDQSHPRLSWVLQGGRRGERQTAY
jgi:hypothetical protein